MEVAAALCAHEAPRLHGYVTQAMLDACFKFTFVCNPRDRLVSAYDFKIFVFKHFLRPAWRDEHCHMIPQYDFLHDAQGNCLVDYVGRFENLQEGSRPGEYSSPAPGGRNLTDSCGPLQISARMT